MAKKNIRTRSKLKKAQILLQSKQLEAACLLYEQICEIDKRDADAWYLLGAVYNQLGRNEESLSATLKSIELRPKHAKARYNLGILYQNVGNYGEALTAFLTSSKLEPGNTDSYECIAQMSIALGKFEQAIEALKQRLKIQPQHADSYINLGSVYQRQGKLEHAIHCYNEARAINPQTKLLDENMGAALSSQGRNEEALDCYQNGLTKNPANQRLHSNFLMTLNYVPGKSQAEIFEAHQQWGQRHGKNITIKSHAVLSKPDKRLRVGYVSADMHFHSVAYFLEPLLAAHDSEQVEMFCYSGVLQADAMTEHLKSLSHHWRDISRMQDLQIVKTIIEDQIDILVDLAGHTSGNYLNVFLRKPAPIQLSWLGYPNTTGLDTIDYWVTDKFADLPDQDEYYSEKLYRLPGSFLCYQAPETTPPASPLPVLEARYVTFGSFNNIAKINRELISLWADVLQAVDGSRILIKNTSLSDKQTCERILGWFAEKEIEVHRIELMGKIYGLEAHLEIYSKVDIGLDSFPYNGTTTTCEALWMGVPVITLAMKHHAGRVGLSLLSAVGLEAFVAETVEDYVAIAKNISSDIDGLSSLRTGLRGKMQNSVLCDKAGFAKNMEAAYREMWGRFD